MTGIIVLVVLCIAATIAFALRRKKAERITPKDIMKNWKDAGHDYPKYFERFLED